jgi:Protein of unknown function (DUF3891)
MIIQTAPEGAPRLAITMDEHTALAGSFARAFGNANFEPVEPRELMLYVISQHDKGWAAFDAAPKVDPRTGLPYNLVDTPAEDITRTSAASPDFHEKHHPYAALVSSMHSWGLYNGRYGTSDKVLINTIAPSERHLAERMLEGELKRQARLKGQLAKDAKAAAWIEEKHLFQNYRQLQFFDTFALYFNRDHEGARKQAAFPRVPMTAERDATISVRPLEPGVYAVSPYPFKEDNAEFTFSGRYVKPLPNGGDGDFAAVLRGASTTWQRFRLVNRH